MIEFIEEESSEVVEEKQYNRVFTALPVIRKNIDKLQVILSNIEDYLSLNNRNTLQCVDKYVSDMIGICVKLTDRVKRLAPDTGLDLMEILTKTEACANCSISSYGNNVTRIQFDRLFPHRLPGTGKNTDGISVYQEYAFPLLRQIQILAPIPYTSRIIIAIISHYSAEENLCDYDNQEIAKILDVLSTGYIKDDNPKYCSHYYDYTMDTSDYSEIYLIPEEEFAVFYADWVKARHHILAN